MWARFFVFVISSLLNQLLFYYLSIDPSNERLSYTFHLHKFYYQTLFSLNSQHKLSRKTVNESTIKTIPDIGRQKNKWARQWRCGVAGKEEEEYRSDFEMFIVFTWTMEKL